MKITVRGFLDFSKKNLIFLSGLIALSTLLAIELGVLSVEKYVTILLIILSAGSQILDKYIESVERRLNFNLMRKISRDVRDVKKNTTTQAEFATKTKENEEIINVLSKLLSEGAITNDDIFKSMEDKKIYVLNCYANPLPSLKGISLIFAFVFRRYGIF